MLATYIVRRILYGRGEPASMGMLQPSDSQWFAPNLPTYARDVAKARQGLKDYIGKDMRRLVQQSSVTDS